MSSIKHQSAQSDAEYAALNHEFGVEHRLYLQCKHDLARLRAFVAAVHCRLAHGPGMTEATRLMLIGECEKEIPSLSTLKTPNVEFSGAPQLHRGASAGTKGYASGGEE